MMLKAGESAEMTSRQLNCAGIHLARIRAIRSAKVEGKNNKNITLNFEINLLLIYFKNRSTFES
jgi:hypothetical protein